MTASSAFDPARSAEIRALLIDTVDSTTIRRRPTTFALVASLTGIALALAGGTVALALSGVIRFGTPEPAPAPPAPVVSPTATPTPTPTPPPAARPLVQSAPIMPHDIDALPASPTWSLDLAGMDNGCTMLRSWSLSDGRALYLTGGRPKEYDGQDCATDTNHDVALTLVDTEHGAKLWTREWAFTSEEMGSQTIVTVLGALDAPWFPTMTHDAPGLGGDSVTITGIDAAGAKLWTTTAPAGTPFSSITTVGTRAAAAAGSTDSGMFVGVGADTVTLYDQVSGETLWTASRSGCQPPGEGLDDYLDPVRDAIVVTEAGCSFARRTGELLPNTSRAGFHWEFGLRNTYTYPAEGTGPGTATDLATGQLLWSRDRGPWDRWWFSGGYLVTNQGNHLESIG